MITESDTDRGGGGTLPFRLDMAEPIDYEMLMDVLSQGPSDEVPLCSEPPVKPPAGHAFFMDCRPRANPALNSFKKMRSKSHDQHL